MIGIELMRRSKQQVVCESKKTGCRQDRSDIGTRTLSFSHTTTKREKEDLQKWLQWLEEQRFQKREEEDRTGATVGPTRQRKGAAWAGVVMGNQKGSSAGAVIQARSSILVVEDEGEGNCS